MHFKMENKKTKYMSIMSNESNNLQLSGIGIFNDCFNPVLDGVTTVVKNYAYWLNKKLAPTVVVTPLFPGYSDHEEFNVIRYFSAPLPMRKPYRIGLPFLDLNINTTLANTNFGIVHAHSPFSAGTMALKIARKRSIPIVATFHSKFRDDFQTIIPSKKIVDHLIKKIVNFYESVDEVWVPQAQVEETIRAYGYKGKIEIVENGVDIEPESDIETYRQESREIENFEPNEFIFLFVGQHIWEKNLRFLIDSLNLIRDFKYTLLFAGEGYAKNKMEKLITRYKLNDRTKFLGAIHDRNRLKRIYASADLFLFPSLYDNAPLVVREAASMHTPSLLLQDSTASEIIQDGVNGYLAKNDKELFIKKICSIYDKRTELKIIGENAAKSICRPWETIVDEVTDRYENLLKRRNKKLTFKV